MSWWMPLLAGCADAPDETPEPDDADPVVSTTVAPVDALVLDGRMDFDEDFDAVAEAQGRTDCLHARDFVGQEVPGAAATVCADLACDYVFVGWTEVPEENRSCFRQVIGGGSSPLSQPEVWSVGPEGWIRRTFAYFGPSTAQPIEGEIAPGEAFSVEYAGSQPVSPAGTIDFAVTVRMSFEADPGVATADPTAELDAYVCGWPTGGHRYAGPVAAGTALPDHVLLDQCGEPVHTGDLQGAPTLFLFATAGCDACAAQASAVRPLLEEHPELQVVTLFQGDDEGYAAWRDAYHPRGPLLRDDGWGRVLTWAHGLTTESPWILVDAGQRTVATGVDFVSWSALDPFLP